MYYLDHENIGVLIEILPNSSLVTNREHTIDLICRKFSLVRAKKSLGKYEIINKNDPILIENCSICLEKYEVGKYKRILQKCEHTFHKKCIDKWLKDSDNCPICREYVYFKK